MSIEIYAPIPRADFDDHVSWWDAEVDRRTTRLDQIQSIPDEIERAAILTTDYEMCRRDPIYWIEQYGWLINPKEDDPTTREIPFHLWPRQRDLVEFLLGCRRAGKTGLVNKARELGVSWTCMLLCQHALLFESRFSAKVGSRKEEFVDSQSEDSLFGKLRSNYRMLPAHLKASIKQKYMAIRNTDSMSEIIGEATNAGFSRGGRKTIMLLDEFAHVHPQLQVAIWMAIQTVARSIWVVSTPNGKGDKFFDLYENLPEGQVFEMNWRADPGKPHDFREQTIRPVGELTEGEFGQEHDCSFTATTIGKIWVVRKPAVEYNDDHNTKAWFSPEKRRTAIVTGGWDFGSGASLLCCIFFLIQELKDGRIRLWIDNELVWQQTAWYTAAADVQQMHLDYGYTKLHFGDPAGTQKESDQTSWESKLQGGGVPLICLDKWYNTRDGIEWAIKTAQRMFDDGLIMVHQRCSYAWECLDNWRRDAPEGLSLDWLSRTYIGPRKDVYSHGGNAIMYGIAGTIVAYSQHKTTGVEKKINLPMGKAAEIRAQLPR